MPRTRKNQGFLPSSISEEITNWPIDEKIPSTIFLSPLKSKAPRSGMHATEIDLGMCGLEVDQS